MGHSLLLWALSSKFWLNENDHGADWNSKKKKKSDKRVPFQDALNVVFMFTRGDLHRHITTQRSLLADVEWQLTYLIFKSSRMHERHGTFRFKDLRGSWKYCCMYHAHVSHIMHKSRTSCTFRTR